MSFKTIRIGRASDNDIVLIHPSVSRNHLELFYDGEGNVFLTDLNSANGTFVNGQRIVGSIQLKSNDIVKAAMSDPLKWKNLNTLNAQNKVETNKNSNEEISNESDFDTLPPPKKRNTFKTIGITLMIIFLLVGLFYITNEYVLVDSKPTEIDPNMPNDKNDQPNKVEKEKRKEIVYDFSCLNDEGDLGTTEVIKVLEQVDSEITDAIGGEVTIQEEMKVGNQLLSDCHKEYTFIESGERIENLTKILNLLTDQILVPKGFDYSIYLIESDQLNAFTAGAKIFVTTKMYGFCKSNDELACVIGHEINHNELGHIKEHLQKVNILSESGAALNQMLTIPFGQKKETHCDLTGIDLAIAAGYNGCVNIILWNRMKKESGEGDYNAFDNLFRSHPYSEKRSNCSQNHISQNYGFECTDNN
jgi:pSer/pThr/pTyr-binding forkhead associated (FHA) protein